MTNTTTTQTAIRPFQVNIPQEELDDLRRRFGLVGGLVVPNGVDAGVVADPAFALPAPRGGAGQPPPGVL